MIKEFKEFINRGNVVDLAVAVVLGAAFTAIVTSLTADVIMPIIGALGGKADFNEYTLELNKSVIKWGSFLTAVVNFLIVAFALFLIVKAINKAQSFRKSPEEEAAAEATELELLTEIRDALVQRKS